MIDPALLAHFPSAVLAFAAGALFNPKFLLLRLRSFPLPIRSDEERRQPAERDEPTPSIPHFVGPSAPQNSEPVSSDERINDVETAGPALLLCERTAIEHALALLRWLQEANGLTGEVPVSEIQLIYREMCAELAWAERSWIGVGRELRKALGQARKYANRGGQKVRVYSIPTAIRPVERMPLRRVA